MSGGARSGHASRRARGSDGGNVARPPVVSIFLKLRYRDPEGTVRDFPEGYPATVYYGSGRRQHHGAVVRTLAGGVLTFPAQPSARRPWQDFHLRFGTATDLFYFLCEPPHADRRSPPVAPFARLSERRRLAGDTNNGERYLMVPKQWSTVVSDWAVGDAGFGGNGEYDAGTGVFRHTQTAQVTAIGTLAAPVEMILDPHWMFVRFEYFDRRYGHSDHHGRVSIPMIALEGYRADPRNAVRPADSAARWVTENDGDHASQCLPWITRRRANGAALPDLDGTMGMLFRTSPTRISCVHSVSAADRQLVDVPAGDARLLPSAARLSFYDLPRIWRSRRYYARFVGSPPPSPPGKFFQDLTSGEVTASFDKAKPLVFSLDDIVLCSRAGGVIAPVAPLTATDYVAVFNHQFDDSLPDSTGQGLYKSQPHASAGGNFDLPRSNVVVNRYYLTDYPDWTRLVISMANMYEVFAERVMDSRDLTRPVGARAAVRWADALARIHGSNVWRETGSPPTWTVVADGRVRPGYQVFPSIPTRVDAPPGAPPGKSLFSITPYFHQVSAVRYSEAWNEANDEQGGRLDLALLRCCGVLAGNKELAINLHYFKSFFDFSYVPPVTSPPSPALVLPVTQPQYCHDINQNIINRWSGNEPGWSTDRAEFVPQPASPPGPEPDLRVRVVWFAQSTALNRAQYRITVQPINRDNRNSSTGGGASGPNSYQEGANHRFSSAHENGHMDSLPDEYNERWDGASYAQVSFKYNLAADPFESDGRDETGEKISAGMMNGNRKPRNRYYWPAAEWARQVTRQPFLVKLGAYDKYQVPAHGNTAGGRTYYDWPIFGRRNVPPAANEEDFDLFLYALGEDAYSKDILPHGSPNAFDGILVVCVRIEVELPADPDLATEYDDRADQLAQFAAAVRQGMNHKWAARGNLAAAAPHPARNFSRCLIHFQPQFLVSNQPNYGPRPAAGHRTDVNPTLVTSIRTAYNRNFLVKVTVGAANTATWPTATELDIVAADAIEAADLFSKNFPRMVLGATGHGDMTTVTAALVRPIAAHVLGGAATFALP